MMPATMESPAKRIIEKFGGVRAVAGLLGLSVVQVYRFTHAREKGGTGGTIPQKHAQRLLTEARTRGIDLRAEDFFEAAA